MSYNECEKLINTFDYGDSNQDKFINFVFSKISKNTKNRFVDKNNDCVEIVLCDHPCIKVIPIFKDIDKETLNLDNEITKAIQIIEYSEFKYVYFVYPKNNNFNKHIQIKINKLDYACSDYMVKIIPYSLNDLKKRKTNGNCNILCK